MDILAGIRPMRALLLIVRKIPSFWLVVWFMLTTLWLGEFFWISICRWTKREEQALILISTILKFLAQVYLLSETSLYGYMVPNKSNQFMYNAHTGSFTKHDSWWIVLNVFFHNLSSSLIQKRIVRNKAWQSFYRKLISK